MTKTLIKNGTFISIDPHRVTEGYLVVEDKQIAYLGEKLPDGNYDEVVDGKGRLFLPGLVNTHGHAAMSLLRGYADDLALKVWLEEKMWPIEGWFTDEDVTAGTMLSILEMIRSGTTAFVDMYDKMDRVAEAVEETGLRARLCRGIIGYPPEAQAAKLQDAVEFAKRWNHQAEGRITTMMSPHAAYTCPPDFIEKIVQAAHDLDLPLHTHMSESAQEVEQNVKDYGERPAFHLEKLGMFSRPCLVAHAVHLTDEEIGLLKQYDVKVSHNPGSNLKLASGIARVPDLLRAGVTVSLGTDSSASNNNLDMLEEIRLSALLHKGVSGDPTAVPALEALRMGTLRGAEAMWLKDVGDLRTGMKADIIALDMEQSHFYPHNDLTSHVVYSAAGGDVTDVWVDGKALMRNRECLTLDEEKICYEAENCMKRLTSLN